MCVCVYVCVWAARVATWVPELLQSCAAARYFTFLLLIWLLSLLMSNVFRLFAFLAPNEDTAQSMVG